MFDDGKRTHITILLLFGICPFCASYLRFNKTFLILSNYSSHVLSFARNRSLFPPRIPPSTIPAAAASQRHSLLEEQRHRGIVSESHSGYPEWCCTGKPATTGDVRCRARRVCQPEEVGSSDERCRGYKGKRLLQRKATPQAFCIGRVRRLFPSCAAKVCADSRLIYSSA